MTYHRGGKFFEPCRRFFVDTVASRPVHLEPLTLLWTGGGIDVFTVINIVILAAAICLAIAGVYVLRGRPKRK
jgi:hypothetical protein